MPPGVDALSVWAFHALSLEFQKRLATSDTRVRVVIVTAPRSTNQNLHAQKGVFTLAIHKGIVTVDKVDRTPMNVLEKELKPRLRLLHFTLPVTEAPRLLRLLALEGVNASSLFPGYGGVVKTLHEESLWDRRPAELGGVIPEILRQSLAGDITAVYSPSMGVDPNAT
jgi:hypothetical protein